MGGRTIGPSAHISRDNPELETRRYIFVQDFMDGRNNGPSARISRDNPEMETRKYIFCPRDARRWQYILRWYRWVLPSYRCKFLGTQFNFIYKIFQTQRPRISGVWWRWQTCNCQSLQKYGTSIFIFFKWASRTGNWQNRYGDDLQRGRITALAIALHNGLLRVHYLDWSARHDKLPRWMGCPDEWDAPMNGMPQWMGCLEKWDAPTNRDATDEVHRVTRIWS